MPRIKRWFPVTHDINSDEEMWSLRDTLGDRAGFVWLEILSIADRNEGLVGRDLEQIRNQLASKCRTRRAQAQAVLNWCSEHSWLELSDGLRVRNYAKYHRTQERNSVPSEPDRTRPDLTNPPIVPQRGTVTYSNSFEEFWEAYPRKVGKGAAWRVWQKAKRPELSVILAALEKQKASEQWRRDNGQFVPHPRTWLNQRRWEDEVEPAVEADTREEAMARHEWMQRVANGESAAAVREELRRAGRWK